MKKYMKYKVLAFFMSLIMMLSVLPVTIFAEGLIPLDGKLQIKGEAVVDTELAADYEKVKTVGISDDSVEFLWFRTTKEEEEKAEEEQIENISRVEIGKKKTYTITTEDIGYIIVLKITGLEEFGYTDFLEAKTDVVQEMEIVEEDIIEEEAIIEDVFEEEIVEETIIEDEIEEEIVEESVIEDEIEEEIVEDPVVEDEVEDEVEEEIIEDPVVEDEIEEEIVEDPVIEDEIEEEIVEDPVIEDEIKEEIIDELLTEEGTYYANEEDALLYSMSTNLESDVIDFGDFVAGQETTEISQNVIITNDGNGDIAITLSSMEYFMIQKVDEEALDILQPGSSVGYLISPALSSELSPGVYNEVILFGEEEKCSVAIELVFRVIEESEPTPEPTEAPEEPTPEPTEAPEEPTPEPTEAPEDPTPEPTEAPEEPTPEPTEAPEEPTPEPTEKPEELTPEVVTAIGVNPSSYNFGVVENGYASAPEKQYITIINKGNTSLTLKQPVSEYYKIGTLDAAVLEPDESIELSVRPKEGLKKGDYTEIITIDTEEGVSEFVELSFKVTSKTVNLQGIAQIADITGLPNGVKKNETELRLPSTVTISTTNGEMKADVSWDLESCEYNRKSTKAQSFTVSGVITLPGGIKNPENISLNVKVNVSVNGYTPKIADPSGNLITGISSDDYTTQSKISFTAVGAGMDNATPRKGDVRYCPANWGVFNKNTWKTPPYSATFGMGQAGSYQLSVVFDCQKFDGESWVNTGEQDKKTVSFEVIQFDDSVNLTPVPEEHDADQKEAVATGDPTVILPLIIAMLVAIVCIASVIIYRKKK